MENSLGVLRAKRAFLPWASWCRCWCTYSNRHWCGWNNAHPFAPCFLCVLVVPPAGCCGSLSDTSDDFLGPLFFVVFIYLAQPLLARVINDVAALGEWRGRHVPVYLR